APTPPAGPSAAPAPPAASAPQVAPPAESPAASARLALGGVRGQAGPSRATAAPASARAPSPSSGPPPPPTSESPTPPPPAPPGPVALPTGSFPTRDDLTLAWGDTILPALPQRARARFRGGRFVDTGAPGVATFALPTPIHRERCAEVQGDVE